MLVDNKELERCSKRDFIPKTDEEMFYNVYKYAVKKVVEYNNLCVEKYKCYKYDELLKDDILLKQTKDEIYEDKYLDEEDDDLNDEIIEMSEKILQIKIETTKRLEELKLRCEKNHRLIERFKNIRPLNETKHHAEK